MAKEEKNSKKAKNLTKLLKWIGLLRMLWDWLTDLL